MTAIPNHLQPYVADQRYEERYSAVDHAVWRYAMRQLVIGLADVAHPVYFDGLQKTGITTERVPRIEEMNACLAELDWQAVAVDGFIPPQVFMEFQKARILPIALEMRERDHLAYTPAPDILHESAGHAPIIADEEYSDYLQRFGEIGSKAMYTQHDVAVFEATRKLSQLKEDPAATPAQIADAERTWRDLSNAPVAPSEMTLLSRLHWWTVEYGLVGEVDDCRVFGAGLLSSLGESAACLQPTTPKLALTVDAIFQPYDITTAQPQLYVTHSCRHLTQVLEEFAATLCFARGGSQSVRTAQDAGVIATLELSSGAQVTGVIDALEENRLGEVVYIRTSGPSAVAIDGVRIPGHRRRDHPRGIGFPLGRVCNLMKPLEEASEYELADLGLRRQEHARLPFVSGVCVDGVLEKVEKDNHKIVVMTFSGCTVTAADGSVLHRPEDGDYHMVVGDLVNSVYPGSADADDFVVYADSLKRDGDMVVRGGADIALHQQLRDHREGTTRTDLERLAECVDLDEADHWLLMLELFELVERGSALHARLDEALRRLAEHPQVGWLVAQGYERVCEERPAAR